MCCMRANVFLVMYILFVYRYFRGISTGDLQIVESVIYSNMIHRVLFVVLSLSSSFSLNTLQLFESVSEGSLTCPPPSLVTSFLCKDNQLVRHILFNYVNVRNGLEGVYDLRELVK